MVRAGCQSRNGGDWYKSSRSARWRHFGWALLDCPEYGARSFLQPHEGDQTGFNSCTLLDLHEARRWDRSDSFME